VKVLTGVADIYRQAGGGEKGEKAVRAEFSKYTSGVSKEEIDAANKKILAEQQAEIEMRKLTLEIGQSLLPEFKKLIPELERMTPLLVSVLSQGLPAFTNLLSTISKFAEANKGIINSIAEHPIGFLMAKEVAASIKDAGIGEVIKRLLSAGGGGMSGGAPAAAAGGAGGAIALGIALQGGAAYDLYNQTSSAMKSGEAKGANIAGRLATGDTSAMAEYQAAQAKATTGRTAEAYANIAGKGLSILSGPAGALSALLGDRAVEAIGFKSGSQRTNETLEAKAVVDGAKAQADLLTSHQALITSNNRLADALDRNGRSTDGNTSGGGGRPEAASKGIAQRVNSTQ
jgi:hypothetical protein